MRQLFSNESCQNTLHSMMLHVSIIYSWCNHLSRYISAYAWRVHKTRHTYQVEDLQSSLIHTCFFPTKVISECHPIWMDIKHVILAIWENVSNVSIIIISKRTFVQLSTWSISCGFSLKLTNVLLTVNRNPFTSFSFSFGYPKLYFHCYKHNFNIKYVLICIDFLFISPWKGS